MSGPLDVLEVNLLHVSWALRLEPLRLNKSGAPNRRALLGVARGVVFPGMRRERGDEVDLNDPEQADYLAFLMALAIELGVLVTTVSKLGTKVAAQEAFFHSAEPTRTRKVVDALMRQRFWNELRGHAFWQDDQLDEEHLSLLVPTGERLIGARGAVFSVLRRRATADWTAVSLLAQWCAEQHDDYLERALTSGRIGGFVESVVHRALYWCGLVELGEVDGEDAFRLTDRGQLAFGLPAPPQQMLTEKGLIMQPNLEITTLLDATSIEVLHALYRIADRRSLADRVATFAISTHTVQRGYAEGATAAEVLALFAKHGVTPIPQSVEFQLTDWERMHRRVTVYANGIVFKHADPEALDLIVGQLRHDNPEVEFVRLGPSATFVSATHLVGLDRLLSRHDAVEVDILGAPAPVLEFIDPLTLAVDPLRCDLATAFELRHIAQPLEKTRDRHTFHLDADLLHSRWPDRTFERAIAFLEPRAIGGLPPAQYLLLRDALGDPARASIRRNVTVLTLESATDADRLAVADEVTPYLIARLGDRTFAIDATREAALLDVMRAIGVRAGATDG